MGRITSKSELIGYFVCFAVGMDLETQQASAKAGGWSVGVVCLGCIEPPFYVLSARGPYLKIALNSKKAGMDGVDIVSKAGEIPSQNPI
ncbi:hypothetical protein N7537_006323 [Penicillium hordei]|uniref:Uncharacterized protein n=1 Tax=Penicillium hordei TaxID=40994 RepID=A0AAD6E8L3_9EURO|nr:uncharacterized protein N7537_006323 [Penicillium hordei]KAJ5603367.1 hypothetical protein N7537_006323 [Penicillium hordei]